MIQAGDTVRVVGMPYPDGVITGLTKTSAVVNWRGGSAGLHALVSLERVEPEAPAAGSGCDPLTPYGVMQGHLDAALVSLREALAVSSRAGGSYRQVEAICQTLGYVDRRVRELPE